MSRFSDMIAEMTVGVTAAALIILLLKAVWRNKMSEGMHVCIWGILLLRFLASFLPEVNLPAFAHISLTGMFSDGNALSAVAEQGGFLERGGGASRNFTQWMQKFGAGGENFPGRDPALGTPAKSVEAGDAIMGLEAGDVVFLIWVSGVFLLALCFLISFLCYSAKLKKMPCCDDKNLTELFNECREITGVWRGIRLVCGGDVPTLKGAIRPVLLLPDRYSDEEVKAVFIHELCHCKNNDILKIYASIFLLCFNWFNPLMWYCYRVFRTDIEMFCDRKALGYIAGKKSYAALLLKTAERRRGVLPGTASYQGGKREVERRIRRMADYKKPKRIWSGVIIAVVVLAGAVLLVNGLTARVSAGDEKVPALKKFSVEKDESMDYSMIASNGTDLFYALNEPILQSNYDKEVRILKIDPDTEKSEIIYEEKDQTGFYLSELKASEDYLVWERITGEKLTIWKMDLNTFETETIYTSDTPEIPVPLSVYQEKVLWYDLSGMKPVLRIYDIRTGQTDAVEDVAVSTPYERAEVSDGMMAFLSSEECGEGKQKVIVYDLDEGRAVKSAVIDESLPIRNLFANDRYFTYMLSDEETDYSLFAYDCKNDRKIEINGKDGMYIFSYRLMGERVLINEKSSNDIISVNISDGGEKNLTEKLAGDHTFFMDGSSGELYYTFNTANSEIVCLK